MWAYRIQQQTEHTHPDVTVKPYNFISTDVLWGTVTSEETENPESSSKLKHGHLRHDGIHTLRHHPGTKTKFHWPLFLISSQTGRGLSHKNTNTTQVG